MDDNLRDVIIALVTVAGGAFVGIRAATITADRSERLERLRWKRDIYAGFLAASSSIRDAGKLAAEGSPLIEGWAKSIGDGQRAFAQIKVIAPEVRPSAAALWKALTTLLSAMADLPRATFTKAWPVLDEAVRQATLDCEAAAQLDLAPAGRRFRKPW